VIQDNSTSMGLFTPAFHDNDTAVDYATSIAVAVNFAQTRPFSQLLAIFNLLQWNVVFLAQGSVSVLSSGDRRFREDTMADESVAMDVVAPAADAAEGSMVAAAPVEAEVPLTIDEALKQVLKKSLIHDGLARGLKESVKALDRQRAHLCLLAKSCDHPEYVKLITALCKEYNIPLQKVEDGKQLGEWSGLCKIDGNGNARRVVNCSVVVVKSWGEESHARSVVLDHIKNRPADDE